MRALRFAGRETRALRGMGKRIATTSVRTGLAMTFGEGGRQGCHPYGKKKVPDMRSNTEGAGHTEKKQGAILENCTLEGVIKMYRTIS